MKTTPRVDDEEEPSFYTMNDDDDDRENEWKRKRSKVEEKEEEEEDTPPPSLAPLPQWKMLTLSVFWFATSFLIMSISFVTIPMHVSIYILSLRL